jgi:hypothetical protein
MSNNVPRRDITASMRSLAGDKNRALAVQNLNFLGVKAEIFIIEQKQNLAPLTFSDTPKY